MIEMKKIFLLFIFFSINVTAEPLKEIKLGFLATLSGQSMEGGTNVVKGAQLALDEIKSVSKTDGYIIKPIFEDYGNFDLTKAASAAQKLINIDKVDILYPYVSEDVEVVWRIGDRSKVPMIAVRPGGLKVGELSEYLVRVSANDSSLYDRVLNYALKNNVKKLAIISMLNGYCTPMTNYTVAKWKELTGKDAYLLEYNSGETDFRSGLLKVKNYKPDLLLTLSLDQTYIFKQAKDLGLKVEFAGVYLHADKKFKSLPKNVIDGIVYANYAPSSNSFKRMYIEKYNEEPGESADYAYDAVKITYKCLKENNYKTDKLISCIKSIKDYNGATGLINFTKDGDRIAKNVQLYRYLNSKFIIED